MKWICASIFLILMVCGVCIGYLAPDNYTGKEVFSTEQEYVAFKEAVAQDGVWIQSIETLSSDPPIVVQFEIITLRDLGFPYGDKDVTGKKVAWIIISIGLVFAVVVFSQKID